LRDMDILKLVDQVEGLAAKILALKNSAAELVAVVDGLSIADKQRLYTVLNATQKTESFEEALALLRDFSR